MEQFVNFVIRPPRANYSTEDLLGPEFTLKGRHYQRNDLEIVNSRGHVLQCSHYTPLPFPEDIAFPCVVYCHGNSGCRVDSNEAAMVLLPLNITVLTLDFSGSGHSDGDYVSLGWNEKDDLKAVVTHLRGMKQISCIGLWGRSMGAVTSLLYGAEDPLIAGMVLDSPFSNLFHLVMELVDLYKIRLPKFTVKMAVQIMRRIISKRARFDIMDLNLVQVAPKSFIPALFGHATGDSFIQPQHSDCILESYGGEKNSIRFEGDHNSPRPQLFYDSLSIFFRNLLNPPPLPDLDDACYELFYMPDALQAQEDLNKVLPCFVPSELKNVDVGSIGNHAPMTNIDHGSLDSQMWVPEFELKHSPETSGFYFSRMRRDRSLSLPISDCILESNVENQSHNDYLYPSSNCTSSESWGSKYSSDAPSENSEEEEEEEEEEELYSEQESLSGQRDLNDDEISLSEHSGEKSYLLQNFAPCPIDSNGDQVMIMKVMTTSIPDSMGTEEAKVVDLVQPLDQKSRPTKKNRLDCLSHLLRLNCFKGMGHRRKVTPWKRHL